MTRFFFGLLLILGLGAAGFGGVQLFAPHLLGSIPGLSAEGPAPVTAVEPVVSAPEPSVAAAPPPSAVVATPAVTTMPDGVGAANFDKDAEAEEPMFGASSAPFLAGSPAPINAQEPPAAPRVEETLREVPVAYETPTLASYGKPFDVTFSLDATGAETATGGLPRVGAIVEGQARVSDRVKASLVGAAFDIELVSPQLQLLGADAPNVWRWRVTPKEAGDQRLYVELFAMVGEDARPVRTFNGTVMVEVTRFQKAVSLATAANPLAVFLGGIGSIFGGLFGFVRFLGRRS